MHISVILELVVGGVVGLVGWFNIFHDWWWGPFMAEEDKGKLDLLL